MTVLGVIPARYQSSRFPGKPLAKIMGKSMIEYVYIQTDRSRLIDRLIVATDDQRIIDTVDSMGGEAVLTPGNLKTGSDRAAYVARTVNCDIVANIQGDEVFITPEVIDDCISALQSDDKVLVSTAAKEDISREDLNNPNRVKVLADRNGDAIYFSRSKIPYIRDQIELDNDHPAMLHIGLYVFRKDFLMRFTDFSESVLEKMEKLEQLRILENGYSIKVVKADIDSIGIDSPEDIAKAERILKAEIR